MDHPKDHSLFGLGLPGLLFGKKIFEDPKKSEKLVVENPRFADVTLKSFGFP